MKKMVLKIILTPIFGLFVLLAIILVCILLKGNEITTRVSDYIYPALQKPYENEAPPTPSSFPASSEISAVIGGKGEGLNCSLPNNPPYYDPRLIESLFLSDPKSIDNDAEDEKGKNKKSPAAPASLQFRQACAFHDYCYRHGAATYGYNQVDCDFMLQEYAYRLCKLISTTKNLEEKHKNCMSRARRILLGVRAGGSRSFKAEGQSTYFEFDPIPARADDYNVSRLVTLPEKEEIKLDDKNILKKSVITYSIKRGTVTPNLLTWKSCPSSKEKYCIDIITPKGKYFPMPNQAIITPPRVVTIGEGERLIANARVDFSNTMIYMTEYPLANKNKEFTDIKWVAGKEFEHDSSIRFLRANEIGGIDLLSFSHRYINGEPPYYPLSRDRFDKNKNGNLILNDTSLPKTGELNDKIPDRYRLLQIEPIIGNFLSTKCEQMLMINRGEPDFEADETVDLGNKGKNYETTVRGYFANLNNPSNPDCNTKHDPITFNLDEKSEPFAAVSLENGRDGLLSVRIDNPDIPDNKRINEPVTLELRDLSSCNKEKCVSTVVIPKPLDASWVRMPVQVLPSREQTKEQKKTSLLFFSRILCSSKEGKKEVICSDIEKSDYPETVKFEFQYYRLTADSNKPALKSIGKGSCSIDLSEQRKAFPNSDLEYKIKFVVKDNERNDDKKVNPWIFRDFANRWNASQVIPGRIFDDQPDSDRLDVAVIFKGYVEFSLLLKGQPSKEKGYQYQFGVFSPNYILCDKYAM